MGSFFSVLMPHTADASTGLIAENVSCELCPIPYNVKKKAMKKYGYHSIRDKDETVGLTFRKKSSSKNTWTDGQRNK